MFDEFAKWVIALGKLSEKYFVYKSPLPPLRRIIIHNFFILFTINTTHNYYLYLYSSSFQHINSSIFHSSSILLLLYILPILPSSLPLVLYISLVSYPHLSSISYPSLFVPSSCSPISINCIFLYFV